MSRLPSCANRMGESGAGAESSWSFYGGARRIPLYDGIKSKHEGEREARIMCGVNHLTVLAVADGTSAPLQAADCTTETDLLGLEWLSRSAVQSWPVLAQERRKQALEEIIRGSQQLLQSFEEPFVDDSRRTGDAGDRAAAAGRWGEQVAGRQFAERRIRQAKHALARLYDGVGSICEGCGDRVDSARLVTIPETTMCIECQRRREAHLHPRTKPWSRWDSCKTHPSRDI